MSGVNTVTVEERLTVVGHKVAEKASGIGGVRETIVDLGNRMDRRFEAVDCRFEAMELRFDQRLESMEQRFDQRLRSVGQDVDRRFGSMEERFDRRFETMDQNMSRQFRLTIGIQLTTLLAMVGAIATLAAAALGR